MSNACDLDIVLDLTPDEVAFLSKLPSDFRRHTFAQLMAAADRVARSRAGVEAVLRGMHPQTPEPDRADLDRIEFRLRAWWTALASELRRRCDEGKAEP